MIVNMELIIAKTNLSVRYICVDTCAVILRFDQLRNPMYSRQVRS
jgi:hypothetical protein